MSELRTTHALLRQQAGWQGPYNDLHRIAGTIDWSAYSTEFDMVEPCWKDVKEAYWMQWEKRSAEPYILRVSRRIYLCERGVSKDAWKPWSHLSSLLADAILVLNRSAFSKLELHVQMFLHKDGPRLLIEPIARCLLVIDLQVVMQEHFSQDQTRLGISQVLAKTLTNCQLILARQQKYMISYVHSAYTEWVESRLLVMRKFCGRVGHPAFGYEIIGSKKVRGILGYPGKRYVD